MYEELSADYVRKSYRYLRLGLVASAVLLAVSIVLEVGAAPDCLQTSISGYYYTPVRGVFVAVLLAIGVALIAIKGKGLEDLWLNFAGMMAPVVAFVPTRNAGDCWSTPAFPIQEGADVQAELARWAATNIGNNLRALIIAGLIALVVAVYVLIRYDNHAWKPPLWLTDATGSTRRGMTLMFGVVVLVWVLYEVEWQWFRSQLHNIAAIAMFIFLGAASVTNARRRDPESARDAAPDTMSEDQKARLVRSTTWYRRWYWGIPAAMLASAIIIGLISLFGDWEHSVLVLEAVEILLFAAYWVVQTIEHWKQEVTLTA